MGQNLALNIAEKIGPAGQSVAVCNRSPAKVDETVARAAAEGGLPLFGYKDVRGQAREQPPLRLVVARAPPHAPPPPLFRALPLPSRSQPAEFIAALQRPRAVIILVQAGKPVDDTIALLSGFMEPGDLLIDGGNEWYPNSLRRGAELAAKQLLFMGMGVSGGEDGARHGPSLMPGGPQAAYDMVKDVLEKIAAKVRAEFFLPPRRACTHSWVRPPSRSPPPPFSPARAHHARCRPTLAPAWRTSASWAAATTLR
jgi:6-phosphogluconate dehydrogenase